MIIGIDGNEANVDNKVGVNQYAFNILWGLYNNQEKWQDKHKIIVYLSRPPLKQLPKQNDVWRYEVLPGKGVWTITKLMPHLFFNRLKPKVFYTPSHYVPPLSPMPKICSIMDLGYLEYTGQFKKYDYWQLKLWSAWSIFVSKYVIAISEKTKKDIVRHYPNASDKVVVTHLGYDKEHFNLMKSENNVRRIKQKYEIKKDFVIFVSTLKPSKNVEGLLEAWKLVIDEQKNIDLVIAGKKGWFYESIYKKAKDLGLSERVNFTDFIPEQDKVSLIKSAKAFVMPSFWEGFGLDAVSAMASGTPVVVSDRGSLPEVVGDAGILVDPDDPKDIAGGIMKVMNMDKKEYNSIVKKGVQRAKKFSWDKAALKTLRIIEKAGK